MAHDPQTTSSLFDWRTRRQLDRLEAERSALRQRIGRLRPNAHYRLELEARLRALTLEQMRLEVTMDGPDGP
jgi:hypothetical protein